MIYLGSKNRIAKHIVPLIQEELEKESIEVYIEPFCGGCNMMDKIDYHNRVASDNHKYLIALFTHLQENEPSLPLDISKEDYSAVRMAIRNNDTSTYEDWYVGAVGFLSSFNGRWIDGGYAGNKEDKKGRMRKPYQEAKNNLFKQKEALQEVQFFHRDYSYYTLENTQNAVIYCDIPYKDTKQYSTSKGFNYEVFWEWVRVMSTKNIVLVSEQQAPDDMIVLWEMPVTRNVSRGNKKTVQATERLFTYKS